MKTIVPIITASLLLCGCFDAKEAKKEKFSCNDSTVKELVEEMTIPEVRKEYSKKLSHSYKSAKDNNPMMSILFGGGALLNSEDQKDLNQRVESDFKGYKYSLEDIRTIKKDKELNAIECNADTIITLESNQTLKYEIEYKAQLTDNLEKTYTEVSKFVKKSK